ncbi:PepSY-associated TM helix domain-containing protein [Blastomonas sp. AAP53]|uniref:PepSY-associated TM helix domain-containing protein n=1 Tax=Blastomonas sp. AAP53 TaxID=1248760 RepID=UPI0009DA5AFB|nr:PepSY-associated TM helix domain-containing protein [Blastomonas sp. AAP53]
MSSHREPQRADGAASVAAVRDRTAAPAATSSQNAARARKPRRAKQFWMKQLHSWHWISAAISLAAMFVFSVTGITLNHAATISAKPQIVTTTAVLPASVAGLLARIEPADNTPLPDAVRAEVEALVGVDTGAVAAEWSEDEVYVAVPGPGSDAWVSIDRATGAIEAEKTDRGWVSFFNDLHKGRNTGAAWFWLIDVLAVACIIFTFTGLLLLQLHARNRPSTWPLVGLGVVVPAAIILLFMHF